jgi:hypothetical protein
MLRKHIQYITDCTWLMAFTMGPLSCYDNLTSQSI